MIRAFRVIVLVSLFLSETLACGDPPERRRSLSPFAAVPEPAPWVPPKPPPCTCTAAGAGRAEVRLTWSGTYLTGRARLHVAAPLTGALLIHDPDLVLQKTSWARGGVCPGSAGDATTAVDPGVAVVEGCSPLPDTPAGGRLEFEFGLRHPPWTETSRLRAFASPSLFAVVCPAHCRTPAVAWPTRFTLRRPAAPVVAAGAGVSQNPAGAGVPQNPAGAGVPADSAANELAWDAPLPRLALAIYVPPAAELVAGDLRVLGYAEAPADRTLQQLHPFVQSLSAAAGRTQLHVVLDPSRKTPWGALDWRFAAEGSLDAARLADWSTRLPAWLGAPAHAHEGAVTACRLFELEPSARIARLAPLKAAYLRWLQRRALSDPVHPAGPAPAAYWTLLFAGALQRTAAGPAVSDCDRLLEVPGRPAVAFFEVLAAVGLPPEVAVAPQAISVQVVSIVPRKDTVAVKIYNRSKISIWLPVIYKNRQGSWNHWIFSKASGRVEEVELQHTGKPVDILLDPDQVTLVLPFGWTEEGPPEDLDEP